MDPGKQGLRLDVIAIFIAYSRHYMRNMDPGKQGLRLPHCFRLLYLFNLMRNMDPGKQGLRHFMPFKGLLTGLYGMRNMDPGKQGLRLVDCQDVLQIVLS